MTLDEADVVKREAFERWTMSFTKNESAIRTARRDLDAANAAWDKAFDEWAKSVGLGETDNCGFTTLPF